MALSVTQKIKAILSDQEGTHTLGVNRVLQLLEELRRQVVTELAGMPAGSYSAMYLQSTLAALDKHLADWETATRREVGAALDGSWTRGGSLLTEASNAAGTVLQLPWITTSTLDTLKEFTFGKISGVRGDLYNRIKGELTLGILGQKTPQEVSAELTEGLKDKASPLGRWGHPMFKSAAERAEVITGLEIGRAFSIATDRTIEAAQQTLPELEGMWLHAGHPGAPRQSHLLMHGQTRKPGAAFYSTPQGAKVFYPRDPQAPVSEVIHCGCILIPWHPNWGSKKTFQKDFDIKQEAAYTRNKKA